MSTRTAAPAALLLGLCLACGGIDPQEVPATASPDHGTTTVYVFKGMEVPVGAGRVEAVDHRRISLFYDDDREMPPELARYDDWARSEDWTHVSGDRVPLEKKLVYDKGDRRLVVTVMDMGTARISTVP